MLIQMVNEMTDLLGLPGYKYLGSEENEYSITIKAEPESQPRICPDCG